ncbi:hypothetical protein AAHE18_02G083900 [Arachis hypogaea]|nr:uncharacterized protein DS421_2g45410 [Arachis hypogaea]
MKERGRREGDVVGITTTVAATADREERESPGEEELSAATASCCPHRHRRVTCTVATVRHGAPCHVTVENRAAGREGSRVSEKVARLETATPSHIHEAIAA